MSILSMLATVGITSWLSENSGGSTPTTVNGLPFSVMVLADDLRIAVEQALPQRVAQDRDRRLARLVLLGQQDAAEQRLRAQHREQAGRSAQPLDPLGLIAGPSG